MIIHYFIYLFFLSSNNLGVSPLAIFGFVCYTIISEYRVFAQYFHSIMPVVDYIDAFKWFFTAPCPSVSGSHAHA